MKGIAIVLAALIIYAIAAHAATPQPVLFQAHLIAHDAAGRTMNATGHGNNLNFTGAPTFGASVVTLEFTSDQILCSAFGSTQ
jgi:hypothetical protein